MFSTWQKMINLMCSDAFIRLAYLIYFILIMIKSNKINRLHPTSCWTTNRPICHGIYIKELLSNSKINIYLMVNSLSSHFIMIMHFSRFEHFGNYQLSISLLKLSLQVLMYEYKRKTWKGKMIKVLM